MQLVEIQNKTQNMNYVQNYLCTRAPIFKAILAMKYRNYSSVGNRIKMIFVDYFFHIKLTSKYVQLTVYNRILTRP